MLDGILQILLESARLLWKCEVYVFLSVVFVMVVGLVESCCELSD